LQRLAFAGALVVAGGSGWAVSGLAYQSSPTGLASYRITIDSARDDPHQALLPDCAASCGLDGPSGGALDFTIPNNSDGPIQVVSIEPLGNGCPDTYGHIVICSAAFATDRNADGSTASGQLPGSCWTYVHFRPQDLSAWPVIPPHGKLAVNGTDENGLGQHMIHLDAATPAACVGARYYIRLSVIIETAPAVRPQPQPVGSPAIPRMDSDAGS
jgi:hypothetical protein